MLINFFKINLKIYLTNFQYYNISEFNDTIVNHKEKFPLFHLNISFLPFHFQDLSDLLESLKKNLVFLVLKRPDLK